MKKKVEAFKFGKQQYYHNSLKLAQENEEEELHPHTLMSEACQKEEEER